MSKEDMQTKQYAEKTVNKTLWPMTKALKIAEDGAETDLPLEAAAFFLLQRPQRVTITA